MADITKSEIYKQWCRDHERMQNLHEVKVSETVAEQERRKERARNDYAYFVATYFPDVARTKCGKFQLDAAKYVRDNIRARAVFEWARGHAKSTHFGVFMPLWLKIQKEKQFRTMVLVSKSEEAATKLLADLQEQLAYNELYIRDFGKQVKEGNWAEGEFTTMDDCYFTALGRGQSPRGVKNHGRRPDYIIVDDLDDDQLVQNPDRVAKATEWVLTALLGTTEVGRGIESAYFVQNNGF